MVRKEVWIVSIILIFAIPLVSAQFQSGFIPSDLLENPVVVFGIFFILFFATIYYSVGQVFRGNPAMPAVIAVALAFVIAAGFQQQWYFLGQSLLMWGVILGIGLIGILLIMALAVRGGIAGFIVIIGALWFLSPFIINALYQASHELVYSIPLKVEEFLVSSFWIGGIIFIVGMIWNIRNMRRARSMRREQVARRRAFGI